LLVCRVYDKSTLQFEDIDLKKFIIEYKKLKKLQTMKEHKKYYANRQDTKEPKDLFVLLSLPRKPRQEEIKRVLVDSLKQKLLLKKQLKAMRDKKIVEESIIRASLRFTNLDDNIL
jgi:hypothetical protein